MCTAPLQSLALQIDTLPLLTLANLKHDLRSHKERRTSSEKEEASTPAANNPPNQVLRAFLTNRKPNKVRSHHHHDVARGADTAEPAISVGPISPLLRGKSQSSKNLGQDEEDNHPAPDEQLTGNIMPEGDESKDDEEVCNDARLALAVATQRYVNVAQDPAVEAAVPGAPEGQGRVVVAHAADHVLGRVDAVEQAPEAEEAPGDQQLEPDVVQVEVAEHA